VNSILKNCNSCGTENPEDAKFCFSCGYSFAAFQPSTNVNRKDPLIAAIFGFLFGAFGLFYVSANQGFIGLGVLVLLWLITGGIGVVLLWMGCAIWGAMAAQNWNEDHGVS
jgi:TM2 domain-containing membrane protein YozV|tara:strand:+ start:1068 stop:1400 length:333 start_codon:yes stop_codon:yes gene_type:complete